jgi:hypothetical protein
LWLFPVFPQAAAVPDKLSAASGVCPAEKKHSPDVFSNCLSHPLGIHVVRQKRIHRVRQHILPTEAGINLLRGSDVLIQPGVEALGV